MTAAELGQAIRDRRRTLRLTQAELADLSGCSPEFIRMLEKGKAGGRLVKVLNVTEALGLEMRVAVRGANDG